MKKPFAALSVTAMLLFSTSFASANSYSYLDEILSLQPDVSSEEMMSSVREIAKNTGETEEQILEQIYKELKTIKLKDWLKQSPIKLKAQVVEQLV